MVTGGSGGIGTAIVNTFVSHGHDVYAPSHNELDLLSDPIITDPTFDVVINNAGINPPTTITDISDNEVMQVNYLAPLRIIQQCLPHMIANQFGRIINIGSIWVNLSKQKRAAYSASKSALDSLARSMTAEYAAYNILTNTLSPGFISTKLTYKNNSPEDIAKIKSQIPVGRLGEPTEIAELVYMLTVGNTYISGQNIIIDGGFSCVR